MLGKVRICLKSDRRLAGKVHLEEDRKSLEGHQGADFKENWRAGEGQPSVRGDTVCTTEQKAPS